MYFVKLSRKSFVFALCISLLFTFAAQEHFRPGLLVMVTGGTKSSLLSGKAKCFIISHFRSSSKVLVD